MKCSCNWWGAPSRESRELIGDRYTYDGNGRLLERARYATGASTPASSTVYIGGIFEKTSAGAIKKYYKAFGRTIAIRDVPAGAGAGTLYYPLLDHLGSTVELLDATGATVPGSETKYWPYGATRVGGSTATDKMYTGQRQEPGDAALGLYNYKARFYSTMLGRFVSADPVGGTNRYAYAADNPLKFIDPSGLTLMIACGAGNHCENGQDAGQYRDAIISEWMREGRFGSRSGEWLGRLFDTWFMTALRNNAGWNGQSSADVFGVVFQDVGGKPIVFKDHLPGAGPGNVGAFLTANYRFFSDTGADYWIGFSEGGRTVFEALSRAHGQGWSLPKGAVLIEPAIGKGAVLLPEILRSVRVITWADEKITYSPGSVHGWIYGAYHFKTDDCGGNQHCSHAAWQGVMMMFAGTPPESFQGRVGIPAVADAMGVVVECHLGLVGAVFGMTGC